MTNPNLNLWLYRHQLRAQTKRILAAMLAKRAAAK